MSEQSEQTFLWSRVFHHPTEAKDYLVAIDLRDVEGKEIGDPKIRAKEGLEELFPNVGVLIDINVSEAQRANLNLKPVHSPRHDMQVFEILS